MINIEPWAENELKEIAIKGFRKLEVAISDDPPLMGLSLDDLKNRIDNLTRSSKDKLDKQKIKDSLNQLQNIISAKEAIYQVFEWKDNMLYILDPLFLFYLRWGKH